MTSYDKHRLPSLLPTMLPIAFITELNHGNTTSNNFEYTSSTTLRKKSTITNLRRMFHLHNYDVAHSIGATFVTLKTMHRQNVFGNFFFV